ncbi:putative membrane protein [Bartonella japonica]|uniref:Membrane protein n=1 Tax=Bartonella japonica TaxID=357761 RepID=A0ABV2FQH4_9HYPH
MYDGSMMMSEVFGLFIMVFAIFIIAFILALYYSVFKRARLYYNVKKELKKVMNGQNIAFEQSCDEKTMSQ